MSKVKFPMEMPYEVVNMPRILKPEGRRIFLDVSKKHRGLGLFRRCTCLLISDSVLRVIGVLVIIVFFGSFLDNAKFQILEKIPLRRKFHLPHSVHKINDKSESNGNPNVSTSHQSRFNEGTNKGPSINRVAEPACDFISAFKSVRVDKRWKLSLGSKYDDLTHGMWGEWRINDTEPLESLGAIPDWEEGVKEQSIVSFFRPIVSRMEYRILVGSFYTMAEALVKANVTFFLYGGSHLGAHRHHGVVPWDDDIDVMLNASEKSKIKHILSNIPYYTLFAPVGRQWKFFESSLTSLLNSQYNWPFIDIFFFNENLTHIWDSLPVFKTDFSFEKTDVFPLQYKPFENGYVPVPLHSEKVLRQTYDIDLCQSNFYWHKFESYAPRSRVKKVPCSLLYETLPFVFRKNIHPTCQEESLWKGKQILSKSFVKSS